MDLLYTYNRSFVCSFVLHGHYIGWGTAYPGNAGCLAGTLILYVFIHWIKLEGLVGVSAVDFQL